jgi:hypothetical protein
MRERAVVNLVYIACMYATLTIVRYPAWLSWAGFLSMAVFRLPMWLNGKVSFWKLLGCGKNGTFDKTPDLQQWGIITVHKEIATQGNINYTIDNVQVRNAIHTSYYGSFITKWWRMFNCETWTIVLQPIEGHGLWDGKKAFGDLPKTSAYEGSIAVLTRATIHLDKLKSFWANVDGVVRLMAAAPGFVTSLGIGEVPWIKQATFSVWQSKASMKDYAYKMREHAEVIRKTRQENWYKEEMFVRFEILASYGMLNNKNPLKGML